MNATQSEVKKTGIFVDLVFICLPQEDTSFAVIASLNHINGNLSQLNQLTWLRFCQGMI